MTPNKRSLPPSTTADLETAYQHALSYLHKGAYSHAGKLFRQIETVQLGYADVAALIRICDEGKRAQRFVQWSAIAFTFVVFCLLWFFWRQSDFWTLVICGLALVAGVKLSEQIYARFLAPPPAVEQPRP